MRMCVLCVCVCACVLACVLGEWEEAYILFSYLPDARCSSKFKGDNASQETLDG